MYVFDLKLLIFLLLLLLTGAVTLAVWLTDRGRRGRPAAPLLPALDDAPFGLLALEGERLRYANPYARRLLYLGDRAVLPDADWTPLLRQDLAAPRDGSGGGRYRTVTFASGQTARWWVTLLEERALVFLLDVSAQQRAERATQGLLNDLSHELRTPVATLLTHLEILGLEDVGAEVRAQSLALLRTEARRMARLVEEMLELGRLETAQELPLRPLDLLALVEEVVLQITPRAAERGMALSLQADSPLPLIQGNGDRLRQVFLNLLDNALKYAGPGAEITLSLRRRDEGVACAVCDSGPGVPPEHLPHLARRFYRAAPQAVEGSGLGLALVAEILRLHGSRLEIVSPVAEGRPLAEGGGLCACFVLHSEIGRSDHETA
ncbi:MAG: sensor histidine kinase [Anaerolineales bacterium]